MGVDGTTISPESLKKLSVVPAAWKLETISFDVRTPNPGLGQEHDIRQASSPTA